MKQHEVSCVSSTQTMIVTVIIAITFILLLKKSTLNTQLKNN